jgi:pimeloyl-ACP methyl ester carboxylesterase
MFLFACLCALIVLIVYVLIRRGMSCESCEMTFMSTKFTEENDPSLKSFLYKLYRYEDHNYLDEFSKPDQNYKVVLFVAGNGGSYQQARSLGTTLLMRDHKKIIVYTLDLKGEMSVFLPGAAVRQESFVAKTINYLYEKHQHTKIFLVGHSMGGTLACGLSHAYREKLEKIIIISSPIIRLPIPSLFRKNLYCQGVISISGAFWDVQVARELSLTQDSVNVQAENVAMSWASPNHVAVVWENSLLRAISDYIFLYPNVNDQSFFVKSCFDVLDLGNIGRKIPKDLPKFSQLEELVVGQLYQQNSSLFVRILTNKKLGRDFDVEGKCVMSFVVPGTSFPETAFKGKTKSFHPTLLTALIIPRGCKFRIIKQKKNTERLDIHPRADEYYRDISPFVDIFDQNNESKEAMKKIAIFDVDFQNRVKSHDLPLYREIEVNEKTGILSAKIPYLYSKLVYKLKVQVLKDPENNDALVLKLGNCVNKKYFRIYEYNETFRFQPLSNNFSIYILKNFKAPVKFTLKIDILNSLGDLFLRNHRHLISL